MYRYLFIVVLLFSFAIAQDKSLGSDPLGEIEKKETGEGIASEAAAEQEREAYKYCVDLAKEGSLIGMGTDAVNDPLQFIETLSDRYDELTDAAFICWELVEPYAQGAGEEVYEFGTVVVDRAGEAWVAAKPLIIREGSETSDYIERKIGDTGAVIQGSWETARDDVYPVVREVMQENVLPFLSEQGRRIGGWIGKQLDRGE